MMLLNPVDQGKCQVIRCLSEGSGEEEKEAPSRGRAQSLVLSEEIIELLSSASVARELCPFPDFDRAQKKKQLAEG